jgi:hypothetical protein
MITSLSLDPRYDELLTSIHQIDALLDIATSVDLTELKPETIPNYFWIVTDILNRAKGVCENLANVAICSSSKLEEKNHAD